MYLYKFYLAGAMEGGKKKEIYLPSSAVEFMTWFKQEGALQEGTTLHLSVKQGKEERSIEALPDIVNNGAFSGLFFKCTAHRAAEAGTMKEFTAWINPESIALITSGLPNSTFIYFSSGNIIAIANKMENVTAALLSHIKQYRDRRKENYGKEKR